MSRTTNPVMEHRVGQEGLVAVTMRRGDLVLRGVDGDTVRILVDDEDERDGVRVEAGDGRIELDVRPDRPSDLTIELPRGADLVVDGASVDIDAADLHGTQRYRTASGDLSLRGVHGTLAIEAMSGDVDIVADGPAAVTARSVSGELSLRAGVLTALQATTTSGDLRIAGRFEGDGPFAVETVSGDATIAPAGDLTIEARTVTGDIRSDVPAESDGGRGRRRIVIGSGSPSLSFRSTSGDLRVVPAGVLAEDRGGPRMPALPKLPGLPPMPGLPKLPVLPDLPDGPPAAAPSPASSTAEPAPGQPADGSDQRAEDPRLAVLRDLEVGAIDVEEAGRRLEELDVQEADHAG